MQYVVMVVESQCRPTVYGPFGHFSDAFAFAEAQRAEVKGIPGVYVWTSEVLPAAPADGLVNDGDADRAAVAIIDASR